MSIIKFIKSIALQGIIGKIANEELKSYFPILFIPMASKFLKNTSTSTAMEKVVKAFESYTGSGLCFMC